MHNAMNKAVRHFAVLGSVVWGVVELVALQRSRYRAWSMRA